MPIAWKAVCAAAIGMAAWAGPWPDPGLALPRPVEAPHWPWGATGRLPASRRVPAAEFTFAAASDDAGTGATPQQGAEDAPVDGDEDGWSVDAVFVDAEDRLWVAVDDGAGYILHRFPWAASRVRAAATFLGVLLLCIASWRVHRGLRRRARMRRIEERRRRAEDASRAKSTFLATLGHEVRTPMTGLLGMSELLLSTPLDARQRDYVESIHRAGSHLVCLLDDALDVASIAAGRLAITAAPFDPRVLARELAGASEPLAARRGLRFRCEVAASTPRTFHGDAVRVRQVLLNLVSNALKFTSAGSVSVRLAGAGGRGLRIRVSDTGPGMDDGQRSRLFARYAQVGPEGRGDRRGRGLGLAISRELVEAMGGTITVESAPGRGACFTVDLPPLPCRATGGDGAAGAREAPGLSLSTEMAARAAPGTAA
jgi:signal transduction histidine kinase